MCQLTSLPSELKCPLFHKIDEDNFLSLGNSHSKDYE